MCCPRGLPQMCDFHVPVDYTTVSVVQCVCVCVRVRVWCVCVCVCVWCVCVHTDVPAAGKASTQSPPLAHGSCSAMNTDTYGPDCRCRGLSYNLDFLPSSDPRASEARRLGARTPTVVLVQRARWSSRWGPAGLCGSELLPLAQRPTTRRCLSAVAGSTSQRAPRRCRVCRWTFGRPSNCTAVAPIAEQRSAHGRGTAAWERYRVASTVHG